MSTFKEPIEHIEKIGERGKLSHIEEPIEVTGQADKAHFDALMKEQKQLQELQATGQEKRQTLFDEVGEARGKIDPTDRASLEEIRSKLKNHVAEIETIQKDLQTPNLNVKPYRKQMRNKLTHIEDSLKIALSKAGSEGIVAEASNVYPSDKFNPIREFVGRLSHIEYQMEDMGNYLDYMNKAGTELSPGNMLSIQLKMNQIGQEVEFFAGLLAKALESVKTMMNIQV